MTLKELFILFEVDSCHQGSQGCTKFQSEKETGGVFDDVDVGVAGWVDWSRDSIADGRAVDVAMVKSFSEGRDGGADPSVHFD